MSQFNMSFGMRTTETDNKEGDYEDLSIGGSTSSVNSSKLFKTLDSIEENTILNR